MYSFDIFDTLITRCMKSPTDVFKLVQKHLLGDSSIDLSEHVRQNFAYFRETSETYARRVYFDKGEVSIEDIYSVLAINSNLSQDVIDYLIELELQVERECVIPITDNLNKLFSYVDGGEKVVLVSDMYLHEDQIRSLLIPINDIFRTIPIYVSCDYGQNKGSQQLYAYVSEQENVAFSQWTHIGDNYVSDVVIPRRLGMRSVFVPFNRIEDPGRVLLDADQGIDFRSIDSYKALFSSHSSADKSYPYRMGMSVGIHILIPYVLFVLRESLERNIVKLLFVARDGYILKGIADKLIAEYSLPITTSYIYGSRMAWRIPNAHDEGFCFREYLMQQGKTGDYTVSDVSSIIDVELDSVLECIPEEYRDIDKIHHLYDPNDGLLEAMDASTKLKTLFSDSLDSKRLLASKYILSELPDVGDFAFVEVQGTGKTQVSVSKLLPDKHITTFYMCKSALIIRENTSFSVYFNEYDDVLNSIIEMFTRAPHGITVGYSYNENGTIEPVLQDDDYIQQMEYGYGDYINGVLESVDSHNEITWKQLSSVNLFPMSHQYLHEIIENPEKELTEYIGDMPVSTLWQGANTILKFAPAPTLLAAVRYSLNGEVESEKYRGICFGLGIHRLSETDMDTLTLCKRILENRRKIASTHYQVDNIQTGVAASDIRISVVVTTKNRKYEVKRALDSVFNQTTQPFEVILVDCGSSDGTIEFINDQEYDDLKIIELAVEEGCTPGFARNIGIKKSTGNYIAILDSDNEWKTDKLEQFCTHILENPDVDIVFSRYIRHHKLEMINYPLDDRIRRYQEIGSVYPLDIIDSSAALYSKKYLEEIGMFNEELHSCIDWELILGGELIKTPKSVFIDSPLSENWIMYDSLSENTNQRLYEKCILYITYDIEVGLCRGREYSFVRSLYNSEVIYGKEEELMERITSYDQELIKRLLDDNGEYACEQKYFREESVQHLYQIESMGNQIETMENQIENLNNAIDKKQRFYTLTRNWVMLHQRGLTLTDVILDCGYHSIAIYGAGKHGELLINDIDSTRIQIKYVIDKNRTESFHGINVIKPGMHLDGIDAVIVTPLLDMEALRAELDTNADLVSLYDLIGDYNG